jgi:hypothetical protein
VNTSLTPTYSGSKNIKYTIYFCETLCLLKRFISYCTKRSVSILVVALGNVSAQSIEWQWSAQSNSTEQSNKGILGSQVDAQGNSYVVGWFTGIADFGKNHLISQGSSDLFVAKLTHTGTWAWAITAGSKSSDKATAVVLDAKGNLYVAGNFGADIHLRKTSFTTQGESHSFVAQISKNGHWRWAMGLTGEARNEATNLAITPKGEILVTGRFENTTFAGTHKLQSKGNLDAYVASLSEKGVWRWATSLGGMGSDAIAAVTTNVAGEVYAIGYSCGVSIDAPVLQQEELVQPFVVKLDSHGKRQWLTEAAGNSTAYGKAIAINHNGQIVITGSLSGDVSFGGTSISSGGGEDAFVAQLDPNGQWQWISLFGNQFFDTGSAIAINKLGNACVAGTFRELITSDDHSLDLKSNGESDIFVAQFTAQGKLVGSVAIGSEADDEASGLLIDAAGRHYLSGLFSGNIKVGPLQLKAASPQIFMLRLAPVAYAEKKVVRQ